MIRNKILLIDYFLKRVLSLKRFTVLFTVSIRMAMSTHTCCLGCGRPDARNACADCRVARYCDRECQAKGWMASHAVACGHFQVFFGVKGNRMETAEEFAGYVRFVRTLNKLGHKRGGSLFTSVAALCDFILKITLASFPDLDIETVDTLAWHASVKQDLLDHANDEEELRQKNLFDDKLQWKQLWRNLPRAVAHLFITDDENEIEKRVHRKDKDRVSVQSAIELDRSRFTVLPHEMRLMLLSYLPAYSIFAVMETLPEETQKAALRLLMDRDIFGPISRCGLPLKFGPSRWMEDRSRYDSLSLSQLHREYDIVTNEIAQTLVNAVIEAMTSGGNAGRPAKVSTQMDLIGHHFGLSFRLHRAEGRSTSTWMVHPLVSKRFFKILPNELGIAIRNFSSDPDNAKMDPYQGGEAFTRLVKMVVQKIDPSVGWQFKCDPRYLLPAFYWSSLPGDFIYKAPMDTIVTGPETGYYRVAERHDTPWIMQTMSRATDVKSASSLHERVLDKI